MKLQLVNNAHIIEIEIIPHNTFIINTILIYIKPNKPISN